MTIWHILVGAGVSAAGAIVGALFTFQERLLYFPTIPSRSYDQRPDDYAMPYEDVSIITSDNVRLHAWLIKRPEESKQVPTFLYFHGNAGNIGHRLPDTRRWYDMGANVLMVSYRGYGQSEGYPVEKGIKLDAKAALEYLAGRRDVLNTTKLWAFGRSIGGSVALHLAADPEIGSLLRGVVVENTFTSIDDLIDILLPPLKPFKFLNRNRWNTASIISKVNQPVLFLSGLRDELVPPLHVKRLYEAAVNSKMKRLKAFPDGSHNDTWHQGGPAYHMAIKSFLEQSDKDTSPSERNG